MDSNNPIASTSSNGDEKKEFIIPFGYKFDPTDVELVKLYMIPKLKGEELPSEYIMDIDDVYKYEPPHLLFMNQLKHTRENEVFFFTREKREESRIRAAPNGTYWKVDQGNMPIIDNRAIGEGTIGFKTKLFFHDQHDNLTNWKMTEFKCAINHTNVHNMGNCCIVCKIKLRKK